MDLNPKIIMSGKTGAGKSTVGNTIAGEAIFKVGDDLQSETEGMQEEDCFIRGDPNLPVTLVDTQGSRDNRRTRKLLNTTLDSIEQANRGFNVLLHCFNGLNTRFDETDIEDLRNLSRIFTNKVIDHVYIVFTGLNRVSETEQKKIIEKSRTQLLNILKERHITGISPDRILFFNLAKPQGFIDDLVKILSKKTRFQAYQNIDIKNPIAALQNPDTIKFFKSIIDSWKDEIKSLEEFKDDSAKGEGEMLKVKIFVLEIITNQRGDDLKTILKSIKNQSPFCQELADFFLSTKKLQKGDEDKMSAFQIAYKVLKDFDSTYKESHWFAKDYAEALRTHFEFPFSREVEQRLAKIISTNLERNLYQSKVDTDIRTFPLLGLFAGVSTNLYSTYLLLAGLTLTRVALCTSGIGLLLFVGSFFIWTKEGVIEDMALAAHESLLKSDISKKLVISALITFCDIAQELSR